MASIVMKLVLLFAILTTACVRATVQTKKQNHVNKARNFPIPNYLMQLYTKWTNQSDQSSKKIPFNATAVRAMYFTSIQRMGKNSVKLTVNLGGLQNKITVMRDELHLHITDPTASQKAKTLTIHIKDSQTKKQMASLTVTIQNSGWFTIPLHGKLQDWFNSSQSTCSLNVEFMFRSGATNGSKTYPTVGTAILEKPYLIIYMR